MTAGPSSPAAASAVRPGFNQAAPRSDGAGPRGGRSRGVGTLKLVLAAVILAIVSLVLAWPNLAPDDKHFRLGSGKGLPSDSDTLRMINARFVGVDDENRPFVITATRAAQDQNDAGNMLLTAPKGDLTAQDGTWMAVTAASGVLQRDRKLLDLKGDVSLFHDSGLEMHTEAAQVDLASRGSHGELPVQGQSPSMQLDGQGFRTEERGQRVFLTGKSHILLLNPGAGPTP
jgi:lipopolysaccharide export system protein LptC